MKRRISTNVKWIKYLILPIGVFVLIQLIMNTVATGILNEQTLAHASVLLLIILAYWFLDKVRVIQFDNVHMFIKNKRSSQKVRLEKIVKIAMSNTLVSG